jgi:hypothetical protein
MTRTSGWPAQPSRGAGFLTRACSCHAVSFAVVDDGSVWPSSLRVACRHAASGPMLERAGRPRTHNASSTLLRRRPRRLMPSRTRHQRKTSRTCSIACATRRVSFFEFLPARKDLRQAGMTEQTENHQQCQPASNYRRSTTNHPRPTLGSPGRLHADIGTTVQSSRNPGVNPWAGGPSSIFDPPSSNARRPTIEPPGCPRASALRRWLPHDSLSRGERGIAWFLRSREARCRSSLEPRMDVARCSARSVVA